MWACLKTALMGTQQVTAMSGRDALAQDAPCHYSDKAVEHKQGRGTLACSIYVHTHTHTYIYIYISYIQ